MGRRGGDVLMNAEKLKERYSRQQDIVPADRISSCKATIIGVGAIGRQVALQLAAIGIPWLQLIDPDIVEESNLASQGYLEDDLGRPKVEATADLCQQINHHLETHEFDNRFRRDTQLGNVVFCCVDKIDVRKLIWQAVKNKGRFFCDGRMSAEIVRILTACDYESRKYYPTTLFAEQEAYAGSCTAKTTIYCANVAAGLMLAQFARYLRRLPVDHDVQLNLLTSEISVVSSGVVPARD
jgi:sulfur carrier protein ThiS adenylyltransferase